MIAYVDSSVLLRLLLREPRALREWPQLEWGVTSALTEVEVLRMLDALHLATAMAWRDHRAQPDLRFATHDLSQAAGARAVGFEVVGT